MSLAAEAAEGALSSYLANEQRKGANEVDLANEKAMLDFNTLNQHQKPLDRNSHLLSGLLSIYGSNPELYGKTDWSKFGDLGPAGVTRADMTYAQAPLLKSGGTGGGTSKGKSLLGGLLKGAAGALANKDAAKSDAFGRAANAANAGRGGGNDASLGQSPDGTFDAEGDYSYGNVHGDYTPNGGDLPPDNDVWGDDYNVVEGYTGDRQGGPQEQMQQGPGRDNDYDYDGDYSD